jgi:hypothetical protein
MAKLTFDASVALDGFITGPNPLREEPLGDRGERLHEWMADLVSRRGPVIGIENLRPQRPPTEEAR